MQDCCQDQQQYSYSAPHLRGVRWKVAYLERYYQDTLKYFHLVEDCCFSAWFSNPGSPSTTLCQSLEPRRGNSDLLSLCAWAGSTSSSTHWKFAEKVNEQVELPLRPCSLLFPTTALQSFLHSSHVRTPNLVPVPEWQPHSPVFAEIPELDAEIPELGGLVWVPGPVSSVLILISCCTSSSLQSATTALVRCTKL